MNDITDRQQEILRFCSEFQNLWDAPPTLREIAKHFNFGSPTAAASHLRALRRKGYLEHKPRQARGSRIAHRNGRNGIPLARIPVYSSLPMSSSPSFAQGFERWLALDGALGLTKVQQGVFAVSVKGNALVRWHVLDGDLLIMDRERLPVVGDIVAILDEGRPELTRFSGFDLGSVRSPNRVMASCAPPVGEYQVLAVMVGLLRTSNRGKESDTCPSHGGLHPARENWDCPHGHG